MNTRQVGLALTSIVLVVGGVAFAMHRVYAAATSTPTVATSTPAAQAQGATGQTGTTTPSNSDAFVATGSATSTANATSNTNTNVLTEPTPVTASSTATSTNISAQPATSTPETASSTPSASTTATSSEPTATDTATTTPAVATSTDPTSSSSTATTTASLGNTASTSQSVAAGTNTGTNTAVSDGGGGATVGTGNAYAGANSIQVVNSNILDSKGMLMFLNLFSGLGIDLRSLDLSYFLNNASSSPTACSFTSCGRDLTVAATNTATTSNGISVRAVTGQNTASTTGSGAAYVRTGNAYASGNAVNLINSNIIRSNYLLVGINDFGNVGGDIVLPSADFFQKLLAAREAASGVHATTSNTAILNSTSTVGALTGGNIASSTTGTTTVQTGSAFAGSTTYNQVNDTQIGGTKVFFLFRIWGNWNGTVQGLPNGITWRQTPNGIELVSSNAATPVLNSLGDASSTPTVTRSITASTTNRAVVNNNVSVYALTGKNEAVSQNGTSTIQTGNAYASANTVNMVNTNLIGANWLFAIFNIFGNLNGNISFGQPDLWLGITASTTNPTRSGAAVTYHFTVSNLGDANATNVRLAASYTRNMMHFGSGDATATGDTWQLGAIPRGATRTFAYTAQAGAVPVGGAVAVPFTATVTSAQSDANPSNNTDHLSIVVTNPGSDGGGAGPSFTSDPKITVTKTADTRATTTPADVKYAAMITNAGGPLFNAYATDVLRDASGTPVKTQQWNLDTVHNQDQIQITYTLGFSTSTTPGAYTNTITVHGLKNYPERGRGVPITPVTATSTVNILDPSPKTAGPSALALATGPVCQPYLTSYILPGRHNDPVEVKKLQEFLKTKGGDSNLAVTGVYDAQTIAAVKAFQMRFAENILAPWGYDRPTGDVYYTTQKTINNIYCNGERSFGLSEAQQQEITKTRTLIQANSGQITHTTGEHKSAPSSAPTTSPGPATSTATETPPVSTPIGMATGTPSKQLAAAGATDISWTGQLFSRMQSLLNGTVTSVLSLLHR